MKRRIISVITLMMVIFAGRAFAGELCDKVGIASKDDRVIIGADEDCVYVIQHPQSTSASIVISPAKLKSLISSEEYTLSYVTEEKKSAPLSAKVFYDGYVKAVSKTDKEDIVYIPIKKYKGELYAPAVDKMAQEQGGAAGVAGGKSDAAILSGAAGVEFDIPSEIPAANTAAAFTCEFGFYAENGAAIKVSAGDTLLFEYDEAGADTMNAGYGSWHRAALDYCPQTKKLAIYVDGKRTDTESAAVSDAGRLTFSCEGSGTAALCDLKYYGGYYYADKYFGYAALSANDEGLIVDEENGVIYSDLAGVTDIDAFMAGFTTDAAQYFTDSALDYGARLVLLSENGGFSYYKIALALACDGVKFTRADGVLDVESHISNALGTPTEIIMAVVLKSADNVIRDVVFSDRTSVGTGGADIRISDIECGEMTAEAFFLNNLSDRTPMLDGIYTEGENGE